MIRVLALCAIATLSVTQLNADQQKSNTLSAKEIREGWILLFDGESTFGWQIEGAAKIQDGVLVIGGGKNTILRASTAFANAEWSFQYHGDALELRESFASGKYRAKKLPRAKQWRHVEYTSQRNPRTFRMERSLRWSNVGASEGSGTGESGGDRQKELAQWHPTLVVSAGDQVKIKNVKVRLLQSRPLFNGKNLDGWKVLPGYKSVFTVTKDATLNVKNGRGDIQTVKSYKDFALQLECISHGKHLNSGIFFRCIPGLYQQGYEAQIRNESNPDKARIYKFPKYDPKTHKKTGEIRIASTAVDYGTGGIYRRMPARKVVSRDKEWFTMTVIAHDNHFATWVNGVQVADWTDHRAENKNARKGCCLNAGVIAIQGHDPTTNLSFRNLRIYDYVDRK